MDVKVEGKDVPFLFLPRKEKYPYPNGMCRIYSTQAQESNLVVDLSNV